MSGLSIGAMIGLGLGLGLWGEDGPPVAVDLELNSSAELDAFLAARGIASQYKDAIAVELEFADGDALDASLDGGTPVLKSDVLAAWVGLVYPDPIADSSGNFTLTDSRWVALQAEIAGGATPQIDWSLSGAATDSGSFSATSDYLENLNGSAYGNSELVGYLGPGTYQLTASQNGGGSDLLAQRVAIGKANSGFIPQQLGNGAHSEPRALFTGGSLIQSHVSVSAKRVFCSVDGVYVGELFADMNSDPMSVDYPDTYHRAVTFARVTGGLVAIHTSHNKYLSLRFAPWASTLAKTAALLCEAPSVSFNTEVGGLLTYSRATVSTDGNTIYIATRAFDKYPTLLSISDFQTGFSLGVDVLINQTQGWGYPRLCKVEQDGDGNDKVLVGYSLRNGIYSDWGGIVFAVYDPSGDDWYNINGVAVGGASKGDTSTPRFTNTEASDDVASDGIRLEDGVASGIRYCVSIEARLSQWTGAGTKEAEVVYDFADIPTVTDGLAESGIDFRIAAARGASVARTTGISGTPPSLVDGLNDSITYRLGGRIYYENDTAYIQVTNGSDSGITAANDYANWGTEGDGSNTAFFKQFSLDLSGSLPIMDAALTDEGDTTLIVPDGERFIDVAGIGGDSDGAVCHIGAGHVNDWDMQGESRLVNAPTISPSPTAPFGGHPTLDDDLVSFWRLDCEDFWPDVKGSLNLTPNDETNVSRITGKIGGGLRLGIVRWMIASAKPYSGSQPQLSAFAWVNTTQNDANTQGIFGQYDSANSDRGWAIGLTGTNRVLRVVLTDDGSTLKKDWNDTTALNDGNWHHVGFVFDSGTLTLYVDGTAVATPTKTTDLAMSAIREPDADLLFGVINEGGAWGTGVDLDDPCIFTGALGGTEVADLYASGSGLTY